MEQIDLHLSVPERFPIDPNKPSIIWLKNSYDQPNLYPWFKKKENHTKYDWYVFNTHWSYEKYRQHFNVPHDRCVVIKNGVEDVPRSKLDYQKGQPIARLFFGHLRGVGPPPTFPLSCKKLYIGTPVGIL